MEDGKLGTESGSRLAEWVRAKNLRGELNWRKWEHAELQRAARDEKIDRLTAYAFALMSGGFCMFAISAIADDWLPIPTFLAYLASGIAPLLLCRFFLRRNRRDAAAIAEIERAIHSLELELDQCQLTGLDARRAPEEEMHAAARESLADRARRANQRAQ